MCVVGPRERLSGFIRQHPVELSLVLILGVYFAIRLINIRAVPMHIDEAIYIKWARDAQHGNLWASLLWDGKPPLHSWMMVPFLAAIKDPLLAGRLNSVFFGGVTTVGIFLIGKELKDWKLGAIAAGLYAVCPFGFFFDRLALAESMMLALFVFAVYFAVKAATSANHLYLIGAGIATGLALLTKGTATLLLPIIFFAYLARGPAGKGREKSRPLVRWTAAVGLSMLLGFAILNLLRLSPRWADRSTYIATRTKGIVAALHTPLKDILRFNSSILQSMFHDLTPIVLAVAIAGLALTLAKKWRPGLFLWAWVLIGVAVISLVGEFTWWRFYLVLVPPLLLSAAYGFYVPGTFLVRAWNRKRAEGRLVLGAASLTALALVLAVTVVPLGTQLHGMSTAKIGEAEYLTGRCAGVGMKQTADLVARLSASQKINVVVNDYFVQLAIEIYNGNSPNVHLTCLELEYRKGYTELLKKTSESEAVTGPTYLIVNDSKSLPKSWPLRVLEEFKKNDRRTRSSMLVMKVERSGTRFTAMSPAGVI